MSITNATDLTVTTQTGVENIDAETLMRMLVVGYNQVRADTLTEDPAAMVPDPLNLPDFEESNDLVSLEIVDPDGNTVWGFNSSAISSGRVTITNEE